MLQNFGLDDISLIDLGMTLEVLHQRQGLLQGDARNKYGRHPVMHHAVWDLNFFSAFPGLHVLHHHLAFAEQIQKLLAARFRLALDPEEIVGVPQFTSDPGFRDLDVVIKGTACFFLQLGR